ncbi:MAG: hypothetical protein JNJ61_25450 [Anaerolineae bacterium]|nr:hypothetical protein [Anaerolineae bacterium]
MRTVFRLLFFALLGALALAACAPAASVPAPSGAADAKQNVVGNEGGLHPPQDLALISTTGRPQFIHSYADW